MNTLAFLQPEQRILCKLLAKTLFDCQVELDEVVDWKDVYEESIAHTVVIPAFSHYEDLSLPDAIDELIAGAVRKYAIQGLQNYTHHGYLHDILIKYGSIIASLKE